ncbi:MAG: hypothetical protein ACKO2K_17200, partial [Alphaproteobacteria bacterium]
AATVRLGGGRELRIVGRGAGRDRPFATRVRLGGRDFDRSWVGFSELADGATLEFDLADSPPAGAGPASLPPPSFPPSRPEDACATD